MDKSRRQLEQPIPNNDRKNESSNEKIRINRNTNTTNLHILQYISDQKGVFRMQNIIN